MSLTKITAEFLREMGACKDGVEWYDAHPEIHDKEWPEVCVALDADGRPLWSRSVRDVVAICGSAEDRAVLMNDSDAWVRRIAAAYGRNDPK